MAERPAFTLNDNKVTSQNYSFTWYPGFAVSQKRKTIESLHEAIIKADPQGRPLEVSTKSSSALGASLSGFNLKLDDIPVENIFEAGKIFENGGPYQDLLDAEPKNAKRDLRLSNSGELIGFRFQGKPFPMTPRTSFYDYIYFLAARQSLSATDLKHLLDYNYFTDIEVDPKKRVDTQARGAALLRLLLDEYGKLPSFEETDFIEYHKKHVMN